MELAPQQQNSAATPADLTIYPCIYLQMLGRQPLPHCNLSPALLKLHGGAPKQAWHTRDSCLGIQTMTAKSARMPCQSPTSSWPRSCCKSVRAMAECTSRLHRRSPPFRPFPRSIGSASLLELPLLILLPLVLLLVLPLSVVSN